MLNGNGKTILFSGELKMKMLDIGGCGEEETPSSSIFNLVAKTGN